MSLAPLHRRLAALLGLAALAAFANGTGPTPRVVLAAAALAVAFAWRPGAVTGTRIERLGLAVGLVLVARAVHSVVVAAPDVLTPWVDLLLVLLVLENFKPLDATNDVRLYGLSFALLVASTAYRSDAFFAAAFIAFVGLATVTLMVGYLRRQAERFRVSGPRLGASFLAATAALSAITLLTSALVFVVFPRLPRGWIARGLGQEVSVAGFGNDVTLEEHGAELEANPEIVLRVEFPDAPPADPEGIYLRGRSFDHFDGIRWRRTPSLPTASPPPWWYVQRWPRGVIRQRIFVSNLDTDVVFGMHPLVAVRSRSGTAARWDGSGDWTSGGFAAPVYTAISVVRSPRPEALRAAPERPGPAEAYYLQLPTLPDRIVRLADSLKATADTRYDRARAVERWFHTRFGYTRDLPSTPREATLDAFLFERREGHCEYFSTAMAVLLRLMGIPARNVTGFLGGEWNDFGGYLAVGQDRAHSWVEVWFPDHGWIPFDPTPGGPGGSSAGPALARLRLLLDGIQHRWSKWVLEYNLDRQVEILRRTADLFSGDPGRGAAPALPDARRWLPALLALAAAALLLRRLPRPGRQPAARETRLYLALRRAYARAGFPAAPELPPLTFLRTLRERRAPGAADAGRLVGLYLRARFGGEELGPADRQAMAAQLARARDALRRARRRPGLGSRTPAA